MFYTEKTIGLTYTVRKLLPRRITTYIPILFNDNRSSSP